MDNRLENVWNMASKELLLDFHLIKKDIQFTFQDLGQ